jgi:hypothetical protein
MTSAAETKSAKSSAVEVKESPPEASQEQIVVLERRKSKKRKKKYSRGTKGAQRLFLGLSKAGYRVANSVAEGLDTFVKRGNKSGRKRRDGTVRYALRNASRGISDGLTELGKAPGEVARRVGTGSVWRVVRVFTPLR